MPMLATVDVELDDEEDADELLSSSSSCLLLPPAAPVIVVAVFLDRDCLHCQENPNRWRQAMRACEM